jgi:hypothetical protein
MTATNLQAIYVTVSASLEKHHVKGPVQKRRYFAMENARRRLYNVMATVWMNILRLQIVMEPAHILLKIGVAILPVSLVKKLAKENALKVKLG